MKHKQSLWTICLTLLFVVPLPADEKKNRPTYEERLRWTWDLDMKGEFDAAELRALAEIASPSLSEIGAMRPLVLHAAFKKDGSFQDLLKRPDLRKNKPMDLALSAYDYVINKSETALDHILALLASEEMGSDSDEIVVMSILDEWDRTIRAFRKHFIQTDGAGGGCKSSFMATRAHLYPEKYGKMREAIEAPMGWPMPLLPREK